MWSQEIELPDINHKNFIVNVVETTDSEKEWSFHLNITEKSRNMQSRVSVSIERQHCPDHNTAIEKVMEIPFNILKISLAHWENRDLPIHTIEYENWKMFGRLPHVLPQETK